MLVMRGSISNYGAADEAVTKKARSGKRRHGHVRGETDRLLYTRCSEHRTNERRNIDRSPARAAAAALTLA